MSPLALVTAALGLVSGTVLALAVAIAAVRAVRGRRAARARAVAEPLRPLLLEVAVGEGPEADDAAAALAALDAAGWRTVEPAVLAVLGKVRGDGQRLLVELLAARGVIAAARRDLSARSAVRRATAAELLGAAGYAPAVAELADLLRDGDAEVRLVAARALGRAGAPGGVGADPSTRSGDAPRAAATALLAALAGARPAAPPDVVARSLLLVGPAAGPSLMTALGAPEPLVRLTAAEVLGRLGSTTAAPALEDLVLRDPVDAVRARSAAALGRLGVPSATSALRAATSPSGAPAVRRAAVRSLGEVGDPSSLRCLWGLLDDADGSVADAAATALLGLGAPGVRLLAEVSGQGASTSSRAVERAHEVVTCAVLAEVLPPAALAQVEAVLAEALARASRAEVAA